MSVPQILKSLYFCNILLIIRQLFTIHIFLKTSFVGHLFNIKHFK